jgi:hypothetical protein
MKCPGVTDPKTVIRFWAKVEKTETCWIWHGFRVLLPDGTPNKGHGQFAGGEPRGPRNRRALVGAHQFSWELHVGPIPEGLHVLHSLDCPYRFCVYPEHLRVGTNRENMGDARKLGSFPRGEAHHNSRLTECEVREIIASPLSAAQVALVYGISQGHASDIRRGRRRCYVEDRPKVQYVPPSGRLECKRGHPLSGDNLIVGTNSNGNPYRLCRTCRNLRARKEWKNVR